MKVILVDPFFTVEKNIETCSVNPKLDFAIFYTATPFPGTRLHQIFQEKGLIINQDVSLFTGGCSTVHFSHQELNQIRDRTFRQFLHHRLFHCYHFLTHFRNIEDFKYAFKIMKNLIYSLLFYRGSINPGFFWKQKKARS